MRKIKYIHPDFPNAKPFDMALDLSCVSSVLNNGMTWNLTLENGEHIKMEACGKWDAFVDECQTAKARRELGKR